MWGGRSRPELSGNTHGGTITPNRAGQGGQSRPGLQLPPQRSGSTVGSSRTTHLGNVRVILFHGPLGGPALAPGPEAAAVPAVTLSPPPQTICVCNTRVARGPWLSQEQPHARVSLHNVRLDETKAADLVLLTRFPTGVNRGSLGSEESFQWSRWSRFTRESHTGSRATGLGQEKRVQGGGMRERARCPARVLWRRASGRAGETISGRGFQRPVWDARRGGCQLIGGGLSGAPSEGSDFRLETGVRCPHLQSQEASRWSRCTSFPGCSGMTVALRRTQLSGLSASVPSSQRTLRRQRLGVTVAPAPV